jgi:hypothetical protein
LNMILCDKQCRHQKEGYCLLEDISSLTGILGEPCGYYAPSQKQVTAKEKAL